MESPNPANEDFLEKKIPYPSKVSPNKSLAVQRRRDVLSRAVEMSGMGKEDIIRMLDIFKKKSSAMNSSQSNFDIDYQTTCKLIPPAHASSFDYHEVFNALAENGGQTIDCRSLIMTFTNFVPGFSLEEKCELAFKMYDVMHSGYITIDNIESVLMSTNLVAGDFMKKRAENFMVCADTDGLGRITKNEFILAAQKLPNLLFPRHARDDRY